MNNMRISDYKKQISIEDKELAKKLERDISHQIGKMLIQARLLKGVTQEGLANLVKTKQPSIARIEGGSTVPSLRFLQKIVEAMDYTLLPPRIAELEELNTTIVDYSPGLHFIKLDKDTISSPFTINMVNFS